jgi:hypothetical protein
LEGDLRFCLVVGYHAVRNDVLLYAVCVGCKHEVRERGIEVCQVCVDF